jgi:regulator of protease activity HflC (stomatin/prohibitin superfamily)
MPHPSLLFWILSGVAASLLLVAVFLVRRWRRRRRQQAFQIPETEWWLVSRNGEPARLLGEGRHRLSPRTKLHIIERTPFTITTGSQIAATDDECAVQFDVTVKLRVIDPETAVRHGGNLREAAAAHLTSAALQIVGMVAGEDLKKSPKGFEFEIARRLQPTLSEWGLLIEDVKATSLIVDTESDAAAQ